MTSRRCLTSRGYLAQVSPLTEIGGVTAIYFGADLPFVLRPTPRVADDKICYAIVGICYIHGLMDGEAVDDEGQDLLPSVEEIHLL